jgi:RluA family pseudouridine synthase
VRATRFVVLGARPWDALLKEVGERAGLDSDGLERVVRHGGIWVDQKPIDCAAPPRALRDAAQVTVYAFAYEPEPLPLPEDCVLLDRDGIVAVSKPAWLPVQRTRASAIQSLERILAERLGCRELRAAHRLDRQTSGVLLLARDAKRAAFLGKALADRRVEKRYLAVVSPPPAKDEWEVRGPLGPAKTPPRYRFELRSAPAGDTKPSATQFRVVERESERARVECLPETGRTHQLRVHLAASGAPICGDDLYGKPWQPGAPWAAERVLLHAASVRLRLTPARAEPEVEIQSPVPADFPG